MLDWWKKRRGISLKWKSIILFSLLVTLPTTLVGSLFLNQYDRILQQQFIGAAENNIRTVELNLSDKIKAIQDISDYMIFDEDFRLFMTTPFKPDTKERYYRHKQAIEGFATFQLMSKDYIHSISLKGIVGNEINIGEAVTGVETDWNDQAEQVQGKPVWTDSYSIESGGKKPRRVISMIRIINSYDELTLPVGRVTLRLDEAEIADLLGTIIPGDSGTTFIVRDDGRLLLHPDVSLIGQAYPDAGMLAQVKENENRTFTYRQDDSGTKYLVLNRLLKENGWSIVSIVPQASVVESTRMLRTSLLILMIVIVVSGLIALIGFQLTIIRPVVALTKETSRLKAGDFSARVQVMTQDEIGDLGRHFNNMVLTIKDLIDYKYKLELRQRESELTMLQRQMDPHFLYNTLDMVRWTARMEKAPNTSRLIETLSKFLRTSLSRTKRWSTLRHEFEFVRAYLELQQMRLGTKLTYNVEFEANLEDVPLLNKVVQPLVENSIKHGFSVKTGGHIDVRAYRDRHTVVIEVRDSGRGFTAEAKARLREALLQGDADEELQGHAICNIHERILIAAGEGYGVELVDEAGEGACVRLVMPLLPATGQDGNDREV